MVSLKHLRGLSLAMVLALVAGTSSAAAKDLVVGSNGLAVSMDPLFALDTASLDNNEHIYEALVTYDADKNLKPLLAVSWKNTDATTWEFQLRDGVRFHDGSKLTARDAVASLKRAMKEVLGSSSPYTQFFVGVTDIAVVGNLTFQVKTEKPAPLFPYDLDYIAITPASVAENANNDGFNSGELAVGTGPYKFKRFLPNSVIELVRNEEYWEEKPTWQTVTFKLIKNGGSRVAALLSGDVDVINAVPPQDIPRLEADESVRVWTKVSDRLIYLLMDTHRDVTPHIFSSDGAEIPNPLKDARVRRALSYAISQDAIVEKVMRGVAVEANQPMVSGMPGYAEDIPANVYDRDQARALLSEAGFPNGFKVTLHGPDGRYLNDAQVTQSVGQMLAQLGLGVSVETLPRQIFATRGNNLEYSLALYGFTLGSGPAMLQWLIHTRDKESGWGGSNRGRYSNPKVDTLTESVFQTFDESERSKLVQQASKIVMEDVGVIPLYHQVSVWATAAGLTYEGRIDEKTLAKAVRAE